MFDLILIVASVGSIIGGVAAYWLANKAEDETLPFRITCAILGAIFAALITAALTFVLVYAPIIFFPVIFLAIFIAFNEKRKSKRAI
jgi:hypothetical protein